MLKKIREICLSLGLFSIIAVPFAIPVAVNADIAGSVCNGANIANDAGTTISGSDTSCATDTNSSTSVTNILKLVVNVFSVIVGFIAVIMIIVGGVKYITSGGDSGNISGAKNTIVYAIIGLVIVALAQVIVHFVLAKAATVSTPS